jgi:hypothetical protein
MRVVIEVGLGAALLATWSVFAAAADLSEVAGHYQYDTYSVKLANGRELSLSDLGAAEAFLDISEGGTITLRMRMRAGKTITQTAHVIQAHFSGPTGYWIAQWPNMAYPVRAQIRLAGGTLISDTHFTDRADTARFGSVEHAVLRRADSGKSSAMRERHSHPWSSVRD